MKLCKAPPPLTGFNLHYAMFLIWSNPCCGHVPPTGLVYCFINPLARMRWRDNLWYLHLCVSVYLCVCYHSTGSTINFYAQANVRTVYYGILLVLMCGFS